MTEEDKTKILLDIDKEIAAKLRDRRVSVEKTYLEVTIVFAKIAINGAFILNGTAAVAVLYNAKFLGETWVWHLLWCAVGALCAVLCAAISYVAQQYYTYSAVNEAMQEIDIHFVSLIRSMCQVAQEDRPSVYSDQFLHTGNYIKNFAILSFIMSLVCFSITIFILF